MKVIKKILLTIWEPIYILIAIAAHAFWFVLVITVLTNLINVVKMALVALCPAFLPAWFIMGISIVVSSVSLVTGYMAAEKVWRTQK